VIGRETEAVMAKKSIDKPEYSVVCALLRDIRLKAGLSQGTLGLYLDYPQSHISAVELASRRLDPLQLRSWCLACGVSLEDFARRLEEALALESLRPKHPKQKKKAPSR
jgi:transcriptional regulator with XRE-family HTH domain